MKKLISITALFLVFFECGNAQQFIDKAVIEYEVKMNFKKTISNDMWGDMMKENMPDFKTGYFHLIFSNNKSIYKFDHWPENDKLPQFLKNDDEGNNWYFDFAANNYVMQKTIAGTNFVINDSIPAINWKLTNENREIAGFNCRKAVGKIMDSVYVFAFYTDEITIPGGPCSIHGLPGAILGLTIPRLYTSYIATKVMLTGVNETVIKPAAAKKPYTFTTFKDFIAEKSKDWFSWGEDKEENNRQKGLFLWNLYL